MCPETLIISHKRSGQNRVPPRLKNANGLHSNQGLAWQYASVKLWGHIQRVCHIEDFEHLAKLTEEIGLAQLDTGTQQTTFAALATNNKR